MSERKELTALNKALKMLEDGEIPVKEETGLPTIKDIMEKTGISRSYAYQVRRRFKRVKTAKEGPAPSDVTVEEPTRPPKPPPRTRRKAEEEKEEIEAEKPASMTREEMEEELNWFEDSIKDFYDFLIGKGESVVTEFLGPECGRSEKTTRKLAHRWKQWIGRRVDPDTMEGWDTYFLLGDHLFGVLFPIALIWWRKRQKKKEEEKTEEEAE